MPAGVYSTPDLGAVSATTSFSASLASTGIPSVTASTTYYFNTWANVGGTWYPGDVLSFQTAAAITLPNISLLTAAKTTAQGLITANATESTTTGDHIIGSLAILTSAELAANATTVDSQLVVDAQTSTLNAAIAAYNVAIVGP
jgi:hypothetical protein